MGDDPAVHQFNDELQSLFEIKPPVSKAKMGLITKAAMKGKIFYKHIVQSVERFIAKCSPEYKVPGLYVIDSIVRQSIHQYGDRDVYAARFSRNLHQTFTNLFYNCLPEDKPRIVRVLNLWQKNNVFNSKTIHPLFDMANPHLSHSHSEPISADSPNIDPVQDGQNSTAELLLQQLTNTIALVNSGTNKKQNETSSGTSKDIRFNKSVMSFDYEDDDEDGDETPTEAEPPLSTTLNKLGMEQRKKNDQYSGQVTYNQRNDQVGLMNSRQPVLERWQKLIGQNLVAGEQTSALANQKIVHRHSRSRSPNSPSYGHHPSRDYDSRAAEDYKSPRSGSNTPLQEQNEVDQNRIAERKRKGFPDIRRGFLTICSTTLWLGHVPKTVSEADISDAFGEFGTITSIDLIPPRGCAYVCMDRRQDAIKALQESKNLKLNGSLIKMAWAPGKGLKDKKFKDFWEVELGASFIPISKIDVSMDLDTLEEGGVLDEDTATDRIRKLREENKAIDSNLTGINQLNPQVGLPILAQPPPFALPPNLTIPPPAAIPQMPLSFSQIPVVTSLPGQDNSDKSPSVDHISNLSRMAGPMISVPNPVLFHAPPPPFSMPTILQNQSGPSQALPLFPNPPPIFSQPPPIMASKFHFNDNKSPEQNQRIGDEFIDQNNERNHKSLNKIMSRNDLTAGINLDKFNNDRPQTSLDLHQDVRPYGRLLPRPGQTDLYANEDKELPRTSTFSEHQQSQPQRLLFNGMSKQEMQQGTLNQAPQTFIAPEQMNQFSFPNEMLDSMLNQAFVDQQIPINSFENQFDPNIQHVNMQQNNLQFHHRGRGFHKNRRKRRGHNR